MILGTYPCCGADLIFALPDAQLPRFAKHDCEECGTTCWTWVTRLNPQTWTEESFNRVFEVDYVNKSIKLKKDARCPISDEFYEIAEHLGLTE